MNNVWFRKIGGVLLPASTVGWGLTLLTCFMAARVFVMVDRHSHSASDTLIGAVPVIALLFVLLGLLASRACGASDSG